VSREAKANRRRRKHEAEEAGEADEAKETAAVLECAAAGFVRPMAAPFLRPLPILTKRLLCTLEKGIANDSCRGEKVRLGRGSLNYREWTASTRQSGDWRSQGRQGPPSADEEAAEKSQAVAREPKGCWLLESLEKTHPRKRGRGTQIL
jgi:hypothetical protein